MKEQQRNTVHLQVLISEDTMQKLNRLILMEAIENDTPVQTKSAWLRNLIEDTVDYELNAKKIEEWNPKMIKQIRNK